MTTKPPPTQYFVGPKDKFASGHVQFILTGFTHETGFRVFSFEKMNEERVWTRRTVRADLALIKQYGIHIQDLPLLCRGLLDRPGETAGEGALIFSEDEMRICAAERAAVAATAKIRKAPHRPAPAAVGSAWRSPQLL